MNKIKIFLILITVSSVFLTKAQSSSDIPEITIIVDGACGMCESRIEEAALKTSGVLEAEWNVDNHKLTVSYDQGLFKETELHKNIAAAGHDTNLMKADDDIYNELPQCCLYRSSDNVHKKTSAKNQIQKKSSGVWYMKIMKIILNLCLDLICTL